MPISEGGLCPGFRPAGPAVWMRGDCNSVCLTSPLLPLLASLSSLLSSSLSSL